MAAAVYWNQHIVDLESILPKLPVHVQTHKETVDQNQQIRAYHQKTADVRHGLSRTNSITYQSVQQPTSVVDTAPGQQQKSWTPIETTAITAASLELQSAPDHLREVFGKISLPTAFTLPTLMALHSAP